MSSPKEVQWLISQLKTITGEKFYCTLYLIHLVSAGMVYDYYFHKQASGQWNMWTDRITKEESTICPGANVSLFSFLF